MASEPRITISPHLCFDGRCEEAFLEYQKILGGTITTMLRYGESPMADQVPTNRHGSIIHASLQTNYFELSGVDLVPGDYSRPRGFFVTLNMEDFSLAQHIFDALSRDGEVKLPFGKTFWADGFGVLVDRFGIPWEINCAEPTGSFA